MGNLMVSLCARKDGRPFFGANLYFKDRPSRNIEERMFTRQIEKGEVFLIDDVEAVERVEAELDAFILKRSRSQEAANREEALWADSTRRFNHKRRHQNAQAWYDHNIARHERACLVGERREKVLADLAALGGGGA
jgi:hypothetical protein